MARRLKGICQTAFLILIVATGLASVSAAPAYADPTDEARKAIQAQYNSYCKAQDAKDIKGVVAVFSKDFVQTDSSGHKITYAQYRAQTLQSFAINASTKSHVDIDSIRFTTDTATVDIHEGDFVMEKGRLTFGHPLKCSIGDSWRSEKWIKKNGVWLLSTSAY